MKLTLAFLSSPLPTRPKMLGQKFNILRTKRTFKKKKKHFNHFKGLSLKQTKPTFLDRREFWNCIVAVAYAVRFYHELLKDEIKILARKVTKDLKCID